MTDRMCQKWFSKFHAGDFLLDNAPWLGRPVEVDSDQIKALIENSQQYTTQEIADILKISKPIRLLVKMKNVSFIFLKDFIYLFLGRREEEEKERERNINVWLPPTRPLLGTWPTTQAYALTGDRTSDPLVRRLVLNPLSHTSQGNSYCLNALKF